MMGGFVMLLSVTVKLPELFVSFFFDVSPLTTAISFRVAVPMSINKVQSHKVAGINLGSPFLSWTTICCLPKGCQWFIFVPGRDANGTLIFF